MNTPHISNLIYAIDELVQGEPIEPTKCDHRLVVCYGKDYFTCCECGNKIPKDEIEKNYERK